MLLDSVVTYLEMTDRSQFRPKPAQPVQSIVSLTELADVRRIYTAVGEINGWSCERWNDNEWAAWFALAHRERFAMYSGDTEIGFLDLETSDPTNVEIVVFGLTRSFLGQGLGGSALSTAASFAWRNRQCKRLWLHTATLDSEHALPNYVARGFTVFKTEKSKRQMPNDVLARIRVDRPAFGKKPTQ